MARKKAKSVDTRSNLRVVTANNFITAMGIENLTLKARKLLYVAISQVKQEDKEFFEFKITPLEFAHLMGIDASNVYDEAQKICDELTPLWIRIREDDGTTNYTVFSKVRYSETSDITFKLNKDMSNFLLELKKNFSKPLLLDFMRMRSPYSMAIWHHMQKEMHSLKPLIGKPIKFELSLQELREVTGTVDKATYNRISNFKDKILDKALREIKETAGVEVTYENILHHKKVVGFSFTATSLYEPAEPFDLIWVEQVEERAKAARAKGGLEY